MRTQQTSDLTSAGASFTGIVADDTQSIPSFSAPPVQAIHALGGEPVSRGDHQSAVHGDDWKVDEHWTAVTGYLADLYLPNEG